MIDSKYWLDQVADEAIAQFPKGEIITASGHSPSGTYHIGSLRELITPNVISWGINQRGRKSRHIDFIDDFDIFRKVPVNVPADFKQHLGKPLALVPDPFECGHDSYGDHFLQELYESLKQLGLKFETVRGYEAYQQGLFADSIEQTLKNLADVRRIIEHVTGRRVDKNWAPVQILSDDNKLNEWTYQGWDEKKQVVFYKDASGQEGEVSYTNGRVKLNWRVDWPARWAIWSVGVEPHGRDHATRGGSYDTGKELVQKVFAGKPPLPLAFDFIMPAGQAKKMSASAGTGLSIAKALEIMPPQLLRYFIVKARPNKPLAFDPGQPLFNLIHEFTEVQEAISAGRDHEFKQAFETATAISTPRVISSVPFKHLVSVYQAALRDTDKTFEILERTGYKQAVKTEAEIIRQELDYVGNWLDIYAPEQIKFSVQERLPKVKLTKTQTEFLSRLADELSRQDKVDGVWVHEKIYELKEELKLDARQAFVAIYRVILGQDWGPKAGWFLAELDQEWLVKRLKRQS